MGSNSLLRETMERSRRLTGATGDQIVTVTLGDLQGTVHAQLGANAQTNTAEAANLHILSEPSARNTAAAVAYAALYVRAHFGEDAVMWILPADHHMGREDALKAAYEDGLKAAAQGCLVTFGITPTRPETGYGYINLGPSLIEGRVFRANGFFEKPNRETAETYLQAGTYLWNSGMFLFRTATVLNEFQSHAPDILAGVRAAIEKTGDDTHPDAALYAAVAAQPFDKAIMEKTDTVAVVPCDPDWSDIGSWESLWELKDRDANGNAIQGRVVCHDTKNCLVLSGGKRLIACAGVENLAIIETADALLITTRTSADPLKGLVTRLKADQAPEVILPPPPEQGLKEADS